MSYAEYFILTASKEEVAALISEIDDTDELLVEFKRTLKEMFNAFTLALFFTAFSCAINTA